MQFESAEGIPFDQRCPATGQLLQEVVAGSAGLICVEGQFIYLGQGSTPKRTRQMALVAEGALNIEWFS